MTKSSAERSFSHAITEALLQKNRAESIRVWRGPGILDDLFCFRRGRLFFPFRVGLANFHFDVGGVDQCHGIIRLGHLLRLGRLTYIERRPPKSYLFPDRPSAGVHPQQDLGLRKPVWLHPRRAQPGLFQLALGFSFRAAAQPSGKRGRSISPSSVVARQYASVRLQKNRYKTAGCARPYEHELFRGNGVERRFQVAGG